MRFVSTRNKSVSVSPSETILKGISGDGGLFVPETFYAVTAEEFERLLGMDYPERAAFVMGKFLDDFTHSELLKITSAAYAKFDGDPCPLVSLGDGTYILELWHGPTAAFKDMALTVLPGLMSNAREKCNEKEKTLILVATSGDTGKAALEGFKDAPNSSIIVFYPSDGVSEMQKLQMLTQTGKNVKVVGVKGNFDDCQTAVKAMFSDKALNTEMAALGLKFSSANSINWGRLVPQIAYYVSAYCDMVNSGDIIFGEKINFAVPTGNFGNILAAYYAKKMGLPVNKLICASNMNDVLTDFFGSGVYDANRKFYRTASPSMDILVSSNLERLIFELLGRDDWIITEKMRELKERGRYSIPLEILREHASEFIGGAADEEETLLAIDNFYELNGYLLDPHTAVAVSVYEAYAANSGDTTKTVIVSTASPYKFSTDVYAALTGTLLDDGIKAQKKLYSFTGEEIPLPLRDLNKKPVLHGDVVDKDKLADVIRSFING